MAALKTGALTKKGIPAKKPGRPKTVVKKKAKFIKGVERPHVWHHPDPEIHIKHHPWQMAKAQANFRDEPWDLSFEDYCAMWKDHWDNRGRKPENVCMTRYDSSQGWTATNTQIITRAEHFKQQGISRRKDESGKYLPSFDECYVKKVQR